MAVARIRISKVRIKPNGPIGHSYAARVASTLECIITENGAETVAFFSRRDGKLGSWVMQPAGTFVRQV